MKFVRFGDLKAFKQMLYKACPDEDEYPHCPPRKKGFFAFPYAFADFFYLRGSAGDANSPLSYLRDQSGRKLTEADTLVLSETELQYNSEFRCWLPKIVRTLTDREVLKKLGLPKQPVMRERRPSWVCIMDDLAHRPYLNAEGRLNGRFSYLTDSSGDRIAASDFFARRWLIEEFYDDSDYNVCKTSDISSSAWSLFKTLEAEQYADSGSLDDEKAVSIVLKHLKRQGIGVERLFQWPLYKPWEDIWLTILKRPHIFSYNGCVWHHLFRYLRPGAMLASYGTTWVYSSMRDFEHALRRAEPEAYRKQMRLQGKARPSPYGGPSCYNATFDLHHMYEVFLDEKAINSIT